MNNKKKLEFNVLMLFIFIVAFLLRFWNFWDIPFTFDELSAMGRTTFDSFPEMIKVGVVERDSHPAGIQSFLYYWSMLFGEKEFVIKLPFLLAGMVSIYLTYRIGEIWFGRTAGVLSATYVASLQLFVMYSQIARPYISGLFFTLFAVLCWSKYFFESPKIRYLSGFVLFSALAAYNHYFSLLFVTVLGFSGLLFVNRKTIVPYIVSGILIAVLYIPHLSIIFLQAEKGSIGGWLGAPGPYFIFEFFYWLFHRSFYAIIIFALVIVIGWFYRESPINTEDKSRKRIVLLIWLLPAPVFGYIYSYTSEPILQNSLLIFSAPYFFLLLFAYVGKWKIRNLSIAVLIILLVNILSLVFTREYYKVFYKQPFKQLVKNSVDLESNHEGDVFIINDYIPYYTEYYFRKYNKELPFFTTRNNDLSIEEFKEVVAGIDQGRVVTSGLDDINFQVIKEYFPYWIGYENGFTYEQYIFSKNQVDENKAIGRQLITSITFEELMSEWNYNRDHLAFIEPEKRSIYIVGEDERYGPKFEVPVEDLIDDIYWIIDVEVEYKTNDTIVGAIIVGEIMKDQEQVHWQGSEFSNYGLQPGSWQKAFLTMDVQKARNNNNHIQGQLLRFYIWNRNNDQFMINKISVFLRPGNPDRYSL